jgi:hypothetical protein
MAKVSIIYLDDCEDYSDIMSTAQANVTQEKRQIIVPTTSKAGWLDARELVRTQGGLPSNKLHDRYLVETDDWKQIKSLYPAWAREVLVYPEKNGKFQKGKDVVDSSTDGAGRQWIIPASFIPEQAIGVKGIGLFVDPENVEVDDKKVVITSKSIIVLTPFMQVDGWGKMDEATRVPLALQQDSDDSNNRYLWRIDGIGVRPLVRGHWYDDWDNRRDVDAGGRHDDGFGVAGVGLAQAEPKPIEASQADGSGVLLKGVTLGEFKVLLTSADASVNQLSGNVEEKTLEPLKKLIRAIEIKG